MYMNKKKVVNYRVYVIKNSKRYAKILSSVIIDWIKSVMYKYLYRKIDLGLQNSRPT